MERKQIKSFTTTIKDIYDKRVELKRQKNKAENVYKLMMNSCYGKTIQKIIDSDIKIINSKEEIEATIRKNSERIKEIEQIDERHWLLKRYPETDELFIPTIIGCLILDMSKRIMNEVFECCRIKEIPMFYQDTDSIHIPKSSLPTLQQTFQEQYHRELIGTNMGQFHSDFPPVEGKESYAIKSIFCGKKCYFDLLTDGE